MEVIELTVYAVLKKYRNDEIYYEVFPYNLQQTIKCHFEFYNGFKTLIPFFRKCRLTENGAEKLREKLTKVIK